MKSNNTYIYILSLLLAGELFTTSCSDLLTEDPNSYYEKKEIFASEEKAAMAVTGVYDKLPTLYGYMDMAFHVRTIPTTCRDRPPIRADETSPITN